MTRLEIGTTVLRDLLTESKQTRGRSVEAEMMRQKYYFSWSGGETSARAVKNARPPCARGSVGAPLVVGVAAMLALWMVAPWNRRVPLPDTDPVAPSASPERTRHPVTIVSSPIEPVVFTGSLDGEGAPVTIRCGTCHATKPPSPENRSSSDLDLFHQGLVLAHGDLSCLSCHDATNYEQLRLASGEGVAFSDRQRLCTQCHGPTARDYDHGAHGGMTGHWDLTRGPRTRLGCTQCHDPHAPAYPKMARTFFTHDRGVEVSDEH